MDTQSPTRPRACPGFVHASAVALVVAMVACATPARRAPVAQPAVPAQGARQSTTAEPAFKNDPVQKTPEPSPAGVPFKSPSGNIDCYVDVDFTRCDIRERTWKAPPQPADCEFDWGQGLEISGDGKAGFVCAGDTVIDESAKVLAYGKSVTAGSTTCDSAESGVTCRHAVTGHGFALSRAKYRIF